MSGVERVLKWALECCRQRGSIGGGEPVVFYTVVCERYLTLLFRGRECGFNERPWDAATVSGALAEVGQLVFYALVSESNLPLLL